MKSFPLEMVVEMVTVAGSKSLVRCGEQTSGRLPPSSFGTIACEITSPQDSRVPEKPIPCFSYLYWQLTLSRLGPDMQLPVQ